MSGQAAPIDPINTQPGDPVHLRQLSRRLHL